MSRFELVVVLAAFAAIACGDRRRDDGASGGSPEQTPAPTIEEVCTHFVRDADEPGLRATLMTQCVGVSRWRKTQAPDKWPACARCTLKAVSDADYAACGEHCIEVDESVAAAVLEEAVAAGAAAKQAAAGQ